MELAVLLVLLETTIRDRVFCTHCSLRIFLEGIPENMQLEKSNLEPTIEQAIVFDVSKSINGRIRRRARMWKYEDKHVFETWESKLSELSSETPRSLM